MSAVADVYQVNALDSARRVVASAARSAPTKFRAELERMVVRLEQMADDLDPKRELL